MRLPGAAEADCGPILELSLIQRRLRLGAGSVCDDPECVADMLLAEQRRVTLEERSALDRMLGREPKPKDRPALLLPLTDDEA